MVVYKVYSQEHRIRYLARPCSTAFLFQFACLFFVFLPPLFTSYYTSGFYYKELSYTEQPIVTYHEKYDLIVDSTSTLRFCSSDTRLNTYFTSSSIVCTIDSYVPRVANSDVITDQHKITINVISPGTLDNTVINLWLLYQYQLNRYPSINMESLGLVQLNAPSSLLTNTTVTVYGKLNFKQNQPLTSYTNDSTIQNPIIDFGAYSIVPSFDDVLNGYYSRNFYTVFDQQYVQWASKPSTDGTSILTINVIVNTGSQTIRYVPSFWKEFRWTWIQYFTSLLPFYYVASKVKEFVFSSGIVRCVVGKSP